MEICINCYKVVRVFPEFSPHMNFLWCQRCSDIVLKTLQILANNRRWYNVHIHYWRQLSIYDKPCFAEKARLSR